MLVHPFLKSDRRVSFRLHESGRAVYHRVGTTGAVTRATRITDADEAPDVHATSVASFVAATTGYTALSLTTVRPNGDPAVASTVVRAIAACRFPFAPSSHAIVSDPSGPIAICG